MGMFFTGLWAYLKIRGMQVATGPHGQALGVAIAAAVVALVVFLCGWFAISHAISNARKDERRIVEAEWSTRMANARIQHAALRQLQQQKSEQVGAREQGTLLRELEAARDHTAELQRALAQLKEAQPPGIAYPNEILRRMKP
jgi:hypothetical protein